MSETGWWRKMEFRRIKWYGAWGAAMTVLLFLRMAMDHSGWLLGLDLFFAVSWAGIFARFVMLNTVEIEKPCNSIVVNGEQVWP